jgi:hypothetical protein
MANKFIEFEICVEVLNLQRNYTSSFGDDYVISLEIPIKTNRRGLSARGYVVHNISLINYSDQVLFSCFE